MPSDQLNATIQQSLVTLLCHSDEHGKILSNLLDPQLCEGEYRVFVEKAIDYWHKFGEAPKSHVDDLVADIIDDPNNRKASTYRRIMLNMLEALGDINPTYILGKFKTFIQAQRRKAAVLKCAELLNAKQELAVADVDAIWNDLLRNANDATFDPGMRLSDYERVLSYLEKRYAEFTTGIPQLDKRNIVPYRSAVMLWLGAVGKGKSWALVHIGKQAMNLRKKVLHISLEMSEEEIGQRYYQSQHAIPTRNQPINRTGLEFNKLGRISGFTKDTVQPEWAFDSPFIKDELESHISWLGTRYDNVQIKRFPNRSLTCAGLRAFLDNLEATEKFIPDILILDYIGLMHTDSKNHRISLGRVFEEFRGICVERNIAGVTAHQVSKVGAFAGQVTMGHIAEDWSLNHTADQVITYTSTDTEARLGLARLYVAKARSEEDHFGVLISQSYKDGQFCNQSALLESKYFEYIKLEEQAGENKTVEDVGEE